MQGEKNNINKYYYIGIIIIILTVVFLSQQGYFNDIGKNLFSNASAAISGYWAKGSNWVTDKAYPQITDQVQKRGEVIKNEVNLEKENISENVLGKVGDYFSGIKNSIINPGKTSCQEPVEPVSESVK